MSRLVTLNLDRDALRTADQAEDPEDAIRELFEASLVVRVAEAGDYSLSYRDSNGVDQVQTLTGMEAGAPRTVGAVHPFAPVVLKQGDEVKATRAAAQRDWWHVGDVPLGVLVQPGGAAAYSTTASTRGEFTMTDLDLGDEAGSLTSLSARLDLPFEGTLGWELVNDGDAGDRLDVEGTFGLGDPAGDVLTLDAAGIVDGEPVAAGLVVPPFPLEASGGASLWVKAGAVDAFRTNAGQVRSAPEVRVWATGPFAEMLQEQCPDGATQADPCLITEAGAVDETFEAGEKEPIDPTQFEVDETDTEETQALEILNAFLAEDLVPGDVFTVKARADEQDVGAQGDLDLGFTLELNVVGKENVDVPAGSFEAIKITETFRMRAVSDSLTRDGAAPVLTDLDIDETIARTTIWLDASTFVPLKVTAEVPVDMGALYRDVLASTPDSFWTDAGVPRPGSESVQVSFTTTAGMEATSLSGESAFAPYVGLALANTMAQGLTALTMGPASRAFGGYGGGYDEAVPVPERPKTISLSLSSASDLMDGEKSYQIAAVTPGVSWYDLQVTLDGESLYPASCMDEEVYPGTFDLADAEGCEESYETVDAGDLLTFHDVAGGEELQFLDPSSNAVILTLVIE